LDKNMKILIVDDFSTMRRIIKNLLRDLGYNNTQEADDGQSAMPMLKSGGFDFLITDWNMPNMSGLEFVKELRARPDGKSVPVLMVTTRSVKEDILQAAQAGVNNYVVKPFTPQVLKEKIDQVLGVAEGAG